MRLVVGCGGRVLERIVGSGVGVCGVCGGCHGGVLGVFGGMGVKKVGWVWVCKWVCGRVLGGIFGYGFWGLMLR